MNTYRQSPSRRVVYRHAKKTLNYILLKGWTGSRAALERRVRAFLRGKRRTYLLKLVRQQAFALAVAGTLLAGTQAHATSPIELSDIALDANAGGFVMNGVAAGDYSGISVSGAGDVNGDGIQDVIIGARGSNVNGTDSGASYVVFGTADGTTVELSDVAAGTGGFAINGIDADDWSGVSVSGAGDVNGDGLDDLIVGAWYADPGTRDKAGESYVVFGKASTTAVELSDVAAGTGGFVMNGVDAGDWSGHGVSGAGDVNGDGLADLVIGAKRAAPGGISNAGETYVIFGKASTTSVELSDIAGGTGGFIINGHFSPGYAGYSVTGAGDVNGDGLDDIVMGGHASNVFTGRAYVVFGKTTTTAVELSDVGANVGVGGFMMEPFFSLHRVGVRVSGAGDVNGDGLADVIIGSNKDDCFVVFGKDDNTDLVSLAGLYGGEGIRIVAVDAGDAAGTRVSGAGDVNGDGLADLLVGAVLADPGGYADAGESYVVFGKVDSVTVELSDVAAGTGGFIMNGIDATDHSAQSVSGAGDVNGDGLPDLIIGAVLADPGGYGEAGESYVVFSPETAPASATYKKTTRIGDGTGGEIVVPTVLEDARFAIDYSDEDTADNGAGGASIESVTLHRDGAGITNFPSLTPSGVYWELSTDRTGWASAEVTLKYLPAEVAGLFGPESSYTVYTAPAASGPWTAATTTIDTVRNTATFTTTSDTVFALGTSSTYEKWADFGYVGTESGTASEPYDTIVEAVAAVGATGVIHLIDDSADTTSSETVILNKAVTIDSQGPDYSIGAAEARNAESGFVSRRE